MAAAQTPAENAARRHLLNFTSYTYPGYQVNWHHSLIALHLDAFVTQRDQRLMVFAPPRSGKCLAGDTEVMLADGRQVSINNLYSRDTVISLNSWYNVSSSIITNTFENGDK